ncbi:MAG: hypothetical protein JRF33_16125 [Deltaproteobacteria bacterium]|nr:hypothetical protein [Deltaproteobacteria bacterium]
MTSDTPNSGVDATSCSWRIIGATGGILTLLGLGLLALYGFDFSSSLHLWRDHPFDLTNLRFAVESFSFTTRLWGYDPMHLFGWTPNVFYNPLASFAGGLFTAPFDFSAGSYVAWLLVVLSATSLAMWVWIPRKASRAAWVGGALVAGGLTWLVYPTDVGLIDANPVQVLYTGQWAQRIGIALGLLALERFWRGLLAMDAAQRHKTAEHLLAAATLWGASLFSHFMSGYATAVCLCLLSLLHGLGNWLLGHRSIPWALLCLLGTMSAVILLYLDFFVAFFSLQATHHNLPLLRWKVPEGAWVTVRDVLVPALPLLILPGLAQMSRGVLDKLALSRAGLPLVVLAASVMTSPEHMLFWCLVVLATTLVAIRLENEIAVRHWLPCLAFSLWTLACGPTSLKIFGQDISGLLPFSESIGFAKLTAFARLAFMAWLGLLVSEGLQTLHHATWKMKGTAWTLLLLGLGLPLGLSLNLEQGAQTNFSWMADTDLQATEGLQTRMAQVAKQLPATQYLLVEDPLHHAEDSAIAKRGIPHGHMVFGLAVRVGRPVLGGAVTTRYLTHPYAQTARGQLMCKDADSLSQADLDRLAELGIARILVHSPDLIRALDGLTGAEYIDRENGLSQYHLVNARPLLSDRKGREVEGARLHWRQSGFDLDIPPHAPTHLRLRLVHIPWLGCHPESTCRIQTWSDRIEHFTGCDPVGGKTFDLDVPWLEIEIQPGDKNLRLTVESRPPLWSWLVMLLAWFAAGFWRFAWPALRKMSRKRSRKKSMRTQGADHS